MHSSTQLQSSPLSVRFLLFVLYELLQTGSILHMYYYWPCTVKNIQHLQLGKCPSNTHCYEMKYSRFCQNCICFVNKNILFLIGRIDMKSGYLFYWMSIPCFAIYIYIPSLFYSHKYNIVLKISDKVALVENTI